MDLSTYDFDDEIIKIVRTLQRTYRCVYPWMIIAHLELIRAEGSLRRDMLRLALEGRLIRVGGYNARQGYRVPVVAFKPIILPTWRTAA